MFILPIQEHGRSFHFEVSSSISFFKDLKFLSNRSFTSLARLTPRYFKLFMALCLLPQSLWVFMILEHVASERLLSLVSSICSGSYTLSDSSLEKFPEPWEEDFDEDIPIKTNCCKVSLILCITFVCGSLYLFPSAAEESFSNDGLIRYWSMSIAEC